MRATHRETAEAQRLDEASCHSTKVTLGYFYFIVRFDFVSHFSFESFVLVKINIAALV